MVSVPTASVAVPLSGSLPALATRQRRAVCWRPWGRCGCGFETLTRRWLPCAPVGRRASGRQPSRRSLWCGGRFSGRRRHSMWQYRCRPARWSPRCQSRWSRFSIVSSAAIDLRVSRAAIVLRVLRGAIDLRVGVGLTLFLGADHFQCCFAPGEPRGEPVSPVEQTCRIPHALIRLVVNT